MINFEDCAEYFLYPLCKKVVRGLARLSIIALWVMLLAFIIALPISHLIMVTEGNGTGSSISAPLYIMGNYVAILSGLFLCGFLGILFPWCHCVLLYQRGCSFTRGLSCLGILAGLFILVSTLWGLTMGTHLLPNQHLAPFMLLILMGISLICNWGKMEILSKAQRIALCGAPLLLMIALLLGFGGMYFFASLFYLPVFLMLRAPLRWLHQHASLIIELPTLPKEED